MNTAALIVAVGMPMYERVPAAMFTVGAVNTAQRMIASFEKAGIAAVYLVTDENTKKLEKQLSSTEAFFIRCVGSQLEALKQAIVGLPQHYDRLLICPCDRPLVLPGTLNDILSAHGEILRVQHAGKCSGFYSISMQAAEMLCADTSSSEFDEAISGLGITVKNLDLADCGIITTGAEAVRDESLIQAHQTALIRPLMQLEVSGEQAILEPRLIRLLRLVNLLRSVRDSCEMLGISYSIAWNLLNSAEEQLGYPIVHRNQGGRSGAGSMLTEKGKKLLKAYDCFEAGLKSKMNSMFEEYFSDIL